MATSLFATLLGVGVAAAQAPPGWSAAGDKPARTTWQPYPPAQTGTAAVPSAVPTVTKPVDLPPPQPIGSRVVLFTKPAGEVQPVQGVQGIAPPPPRDVARPNTIVRVQAEDKMLPPPVSREPDKGQVFRIPTDDDLFNEKTPGRDQTFTEEIAKLNAADERKYKADLAKFNENPNRKEADRPQYTPQRAEDFGVTLRNVSNTTPAVKPGYSPVQVKLEPGYVVHRRLFFEEKNSDRYGWDLGMAQPFVSAAYFYKDVFLWPGHLTSNLLTARYDTSAGKCMPGSPVPYLFYPPELTISGSLWQTAAVVGVSFLLP